MGGKKRKSNKGRAVTPTPEKEKTGLQTPAPTPAVAGSRFGALTAEDDQRMRELSIALSEDEEEEEEPVKEDVAADRVGAWMFRTLADRVEGEGDGEEDLAFLRRLPSGRVLGSGSGGRRAEAATEARLFAPVFNYRAAYNTATGVADRLREEVAELRASCALLRQGRDLNVVAAEAAAARCVELETELAESPGAWQRKLDGFQLTLDTVTASSQRWHSEFQERVDEEVKRVVERGREREIHCSG